MILGDIKFQVVCLHTKLKLWDPNKDEEAAIFSMKMSDSECL